MEAGQHRIDSLVQTRARKNIFDLGKQRRADHNLEIADIEPALNESVRRSTLDRRRDDHIGIENDLHTDSAVAARLANSTNFLDRQLHRLIL